jgi:hypothetical protein
VAVAVVERRSSGQQRGEDDARAEGRERAALDEAAQVSDGTGSPPDGDQANGRHVHAEAAPRRGDEGNLHRYRHEPESARYECPSEQDLQAER